MDTANIKIQIYIGSVSLYTDAYSDVTHGIGEISGTRQSDVINVFHKKSKVSLDGVTISYTKNVINNS